MIRTSTPRAVAAAIAAVVLALTVLTPVSAISNGSQLEFVTQPATTTVRTTFDVAVAIYNGSGDRERIAGIPIRLEIAEGTGTPGATPDHWDAQTNADGVAFFELSISTRGFGYRLVGKAADQGSQSSGNIAATEPSVAFDILGDITDCSGSGCIATDELPEGTTAAEVRADANGQILLTVGVGALDCGGYAESSETVTFNVTEGIDGTRTRVTITLDAGSVTKPARKYDVCFSSPESEFIDASGNTVLPGQAGLLANCPKNLQPEGDPCVLSRTKDKSGNVVVTFSVPLGDPRGVI
jgi:hypothetical protein